MKLRGKSLLTFLIVAFLAGTTIHVAHATTMVVKMALADGGTMNISDCDGCLNGNDGASSCDMVCATSTLPLAMVRHFSIPLRTMVKEFIPTVAKELLSHTGPPEPYPPKSFTLI